MSTKSTNGKIEAFLSRAERAFDRAAETVRADSKRLGLKPVTWTDSKTSTRKK